MPIRRLVTRAVVMVAGGSLGLAVFAGPAAADPSMTPEERALLAQLDPSDQQRILLQKRIQENAETAALLSELARLRHETAVSTINNIR
jgi:hypothetical protein